MFIIFISLIYSFSNTNYLIEKHVYNKINSILSMENNEAALFCFLNTFKQPDRSIILRQVIENIRTFQGKINLIKDISDEFDRKVEMLEKLIEKEKYYDAVDLSTIRREKSKYHFKATEDHLVHLERIKGCIKYTIENLLNKEILIEQRENIFKVYEDLKLPDFFQEKIEKIKKIMRIEKNICEEKNSLI